MFCIKPHFALFEKSSFRKNLQRFCNLYCSDFRHDSVSFAGTLINDWIYIELDYDHFCFAESWSLTMSKNNQICLVILQIFWMLKIFVIAISKFLHKIIEKMGACRVLHLLPHIHKPIMVFQHANVEPLNEKREVLKLQKNWVWFVLESFSLNNALIKVNLVKSFSSIYRQKVILKCLYYSKWIWWQTPSSSQRRKIHPEWVRNRKITLHSKWLPLLTNCLWTNLGVLKRLDIYFNLFGTLVGIFTF